VLQEVLFARVQSLVFTSATLTTSGHFEHIRQRFGIDYECRELVVASPFDYPQQALLYLPNHLPAPRHPDFVARAAEEIEALLAVTGGRSFVLFTSFSNMHQVRDLLAGALPYPTFVQGEGSKDALLEAFRTTERAVLFGTASFWEGVDVAGEALSQVIIDKLPFGPPDDPLTAARCEWMGASGRNPFIHYQVPVAIIALKQGFGRLIRHSGDRGIVAVLDHRIRRARYGSMFLESLPPARRVFSLEDLEAQWRLLAEPDTTDI
jgi:ATP-dependent DNA helicase DinG